MLSKQFNDLFALQDASLLQGVPLGTLGDIAFACIWDLLASLLE